MWAEITSVNVMSDPGSAGKSMWVNSDDLRIWLERTSPEHLKSPPWHIEIRAAMNEYYGGQHGQGSGHREVGRTLRLQLTPTDLLALLNLAMASNLLSLTTKP